MFTTNNTNSSVTTNATVKVGVDKVGTGTGLAALRESRAKAWEEAKSFLDTHCDQNGMLSEADAATYDQMEADVISLGEEIKRMERREALDAELSRPVGTPLKNVPGSTAERSGRASDEYRSAMLTALRSNFRTVSNVLMEGVDASGGYLVPTEYDERLIEKLDEENTMKELQDFIDNYGFGISVTKLAEKAYRHMQAQGYDVCIVNDRYLEVEGVTYLFSKSRKHGHWIAKAF